MSKLFKKLALLMVVVCFASSAFADELIMKNGDRLTGRVKSKDGDTIVFSTQYGDPLTIKWSEVEELKTKEPVKVMTTSGDVKEVSTFKDTSGEQITNSTIDVGDVDLIKPEPWRLGEGYRFTGNVNFAVEIDRGNTDSDEYDFDTSIELRDLKNRFTFHGELENDKTNGSTTNDKWTTASKYDRFFTEQTYGFLLFVVESDKFADLEERYVYGAGLGRQFYEGAKTNFSIDVGGSHVRENFDSDSTEEYAAATWGVKYDHFLYRELLQIYHRQIGLWNVEETEKVVLTAWSGVRIPIYMGIVGSSELKWEYDSQPAGGADKDDFTTTVKLGYAWK